MGRQHRAPEVYYRQTDGYPAGPIVLAHVKTVPGGTVVSSTEMPSCVERVEFDGRVLNVYVRGEMNWPTCFSATIDPLLRRKWWQLWRCP